MAGHWANALLATSRSLVLERVLFLATSAVRKSRWDPPCSIQHGFVHDAARWALIARCIPANSNRHDVVQYRIKIAEEHDRNALSPERVGSITERSPPLSYVQLSVAVLVGIEA